MAQFSRILFKAILLKVVMKVYIKCWMWMINEKAY